MGYKGGLEKAALHELQHAGDDAEEAFPVAGNSEMRLDTEARAYSTAQRKNLSPEERVHLE
jgi:hypothetical protein